MVAAKEGIFPAAETKRRNRHRNRDVDAHHADGDAVDKGSRRATISSEDGGAIAIGVGIDQCHCLVKGGDSLKVGFEELHKSEYTNVTLFGPADFVFTGSVQL